MVDSFIKAINPLQSHKVATPVALHRVAKDIVMDFCEFVSNIILRAIF